MFNKKKLLISLVLAFCLFSLSFLYHINDFGGGNFSGIRWFGWPTQPISISKVSDSYYEVEKVQWESTGVLLKEGWKLNSSVNPISFIAKSGFNYMVFLVLSGIAVIIFYEVRKWLVSGEKTHK